MSNLATVTSYYKAGLSVIPLRTDGSKSPKVKWRDSIDSRMSLYALTPHFISEGARSGIGIVCGKVSDNLEVLDFDDPLAFDEWRNIVSPEPFDTLPIVRTPSGGTHVYYRCETIEGNQVLAADTDGSVRIETRGQGGMVVTAGSPPETHKSRAPYQLIQGDLTQVPVISPADRSEYFNAAKSLNRFVKPVLATPAKTASEGETGDRPGDAFAAATSWETILEPHGWKLISGTGDFGSWNKPGSHSGENHATTNDGSFYCFSTSAPPFDGGKAYGKFGVYALLNFAGDYSKAAAELVRKGFAADRTDLLTERLYAPAKGNEEATPEKPKKEKRSGADTSYDQAVKFLASHTVRKFNEKFYRYDGRSYVQVEDFGDEVRKFLHRQRKEDSKINCDNSRVANIVANIGAMVRLDGSRLPPFHCINGTVPEKTIIFANGMLDAERFLETGDASLAPHDPQLFNTVCLPYAFNPKATCENWRHFLGSVFDDDDRCDLLQEWFGYCLFPGNRFQKLMILEGPPGAGKGTISRLLRTLIGTSNYCGTDLRTLISPFGLSQIVDKRVTAIGEINLEGSTEKVRMMETVNSIVGNDEVTVNGKYQKAYSTPIDTKFLLSCNGLPTFLDPSGAFARRALIIPFLKHFQREADLDLGDKLDIDAPGICLWALNGYRRLMKNRKFTIPAISQAKMDESRRQNSPSLAFIQDRLIVDKRLDAGNLPGVEFCDRPICVNRDAVRNAFNVWLQEEGRSAHYSYLMRDLKAMLPGFDPNANFKVDGVRIYRGIDLKDRS